MKKWSLLSVCQMLALRIKAAIQTLAGNKERKCLPESPILSFVQAGEPAVEAGDLTVGN